MWAEMWSKSAIEKSELSKNRMKSRVSGISFWRTKPLQRAPKPPALPAAPHPDIY